MHEILVLTGAGLSAESGLATFRDADGLWSRVRIEDVATPAAHARDPARVLAFYDARRRGCRAASPNPAHHALARLQRDGRHRVTLVTQNIDDLLTRAGAAEVIHMHGSVFSAFCAACGARRVQEGDLALDALCDGCGARGRLRPDVVWFGEIPYHMQEIGARLATADLFVAIGTSGAVYPAAAFVAEAASAGAETLEINLEASDVSPLFDRHIRGPASVTVPDWVAGLIGPDPARP